jgi:hypothetical protein
MANDTPDTRIEEYLAGELPPAERQAFEAELAADPALQKELRRARLIERTLQSASATHLRKLMDEVRAEVGPVSPPRISIWDRLRAAFGRGWWIGLVSVLLLVGLYLVTPRLVPCPTAAVIDDYFLAPTLVNVQAGDEIDRNLAFRASTYYYEGDAEALEKLFTESRSIFAQYYLGHDYLRRNDYSRAESTFRRLLAQGAELAAYAEYQDLDQLRLNLILSTFGTNDDPAATRRALEELLTSPTLESESDVAVRARALTEELTVTWRWRFCL